ncbi:tail fiber protein [Xylophilus sp. GW821-FHT01B05]
MSQPYLGEIRIVSFDFAPRGWALCNGQLMPINQNQALFSLMSTRYGGDGTTNFQLPDLRGRMPMHQGSGFVQGKSGGEERHTLTVGEMPGHNHLLMGTSATGRATAPAGNVLAAARGHYAEGAGVALDAQSVSSTGGNQSHDNMPPYLALNFVVALAGIFPSRN